MTGNFRVALHELIVSLGQLQYHPEHGDMARSLLKKWDISRGQDWVNETLKEFKEKSQ